jgi:prolyl oligopeptidase
MPSVPFRVAATGATLLVFIASACRRAEPAASLPVPPATRAEEVVETLHGVEVLDPYRWLEDQAAPEVRRWIEEQNAYTDAVLAAAPDRAELHRRVTELLKVDEVDPPEGRGNRYFWSARLADQKLPVIFLREGLEGEDQVLIDPHQLAPDGSRSVVLVDVSQDGERVVYGVREGGQDEVELRVLDVATRQDLPDRVRKGRYYGGATFTPDGQALVYTRHEAEGPRVYRRPLSGAEAAEEELFGAGYGPEILILPHLSPDGRWLTLNVAFGSAGDRGDVFLRDLTSGGPARPVVEDGGGRFFGGVVEGTLVLQTNWEAPNGRILAAPASDPRRERWREVVPEQTDAVIRAVMPLSQRLFVHYLENVQSRVRMFDLAGSDLGSVELEGIGSIGGLSGQWDRDEVFYSFSSFHIPETVYRFQVPSGERSVWDRAELPVDSAAMEVRQVFYPSKDGTRIPMFLVHRKGLPLDGSHPTLLTGYGGFNVSLTPSFSAATALWVERGGVFAVANLRGGGEYGEEWHRAGMLQQKQNVFDDFVAAAEWLVQEGYTRPERLAVRGGSNGGLLVGAFLTQRPDLARAVICAYPLLDMVRYHQFLVARFWVPEYGSAEDPEDFPVLYSYSPYHNVRVGEGYPAVFFLSGDGDTRVAPLHARKMAARVQAASGSGRPVLLRYHTEAGHAGARPVDEEIEDLTESLSFLLWQLEA